MLPLFTTQNYFSVKVAPASPICLSSWHGSKRAWVLVKTEGGGSTVKSRGETKLVQGVLQLSLIHISEPTRPHD